MYDERTISGIGSIVDSVALLAPGISENRFRTYYPYYSYDCG